MRVALRPFLSSHEFLLVVSQDGYGSPSVRYFRYVIECCIANSGAVRGYVEAGQLSYRDPRSNVFLSIRLFDFEIVLCCVCSIEISSFRTFEPPKFQIHMKVGGEQERRRLKPCSRSLEEVIIILKAVTLIGARVAYVNAPHIYVRSLGSSVD